MPSRDYSFLDIAVLDDVRSRFAAGDAVAVLSTDLDEVVWANGQGAALFGYTDIESIMSADTRLPAAARRQIMATPGYPDIGRDQPVGVRLASGVGSRMVGFLASRIALPGGEPAILLTLPDPHGGSRTPEETAERTLSGFGEPGHSAAMIGADGRLIAATIGFPSLGIGVETLAGLVAEVGAAPDRLVKRLVPANAGQLPAGIARLADEPLLGLLVVVEPASEVSPSPEITPLPEDDVAQPLPAADQAETPTFGDDRQAESENTRAEPDETADDDHWYFHTDERAAASHRPMPVEPTSEEPQAATASTGTEAPAETDRHEPPAPVRFAWRTDAAGRFGAISDEFAQTVGMKSSDLIGVAFADVAARFGLDPDKEIAGLLERRDTWSGRTVLWPVGDGSSQIPVDLAALPVYDRNRNFEGFRGFGVARPGDAVAVESAADVSPELEEQTPSADVGQQPVSDEAASESPARDPFEGEVPALSIAPKPDRRSSDKVIRLAEHRQPANDKGLTPVERNAFREIGDRLKQTGAASGPATTATVKEDVSTSGRQATDDDAPASEARSDEAAAQAEESATGAEAAVEDAASANNHEAAKAEEVSSAQPSPTASFLPSAFAAEKSARAAVDTSILDKLPVPVLIHSGDVLHYANREFLEFTAYPSVEALTEAGGLDVLFGDPYRDEAENERADRKLRLRRGDGLELPVEALLQSVPWNGGKALLLALRKVGRMPVSAATSEVTSEERTELKSRIAELRTIIDTATDGVVLIDNDGAIRSISRPAEALFGVDTADVVGKQFTHLFAIESQRAARDYLSGLSENGVASVLNDGREVIGREAQGRFIPLFMTIGKLPNLGGYCAVLRDITQWKRAEEDLTQSRAQAERASSQKTDFLARVSHEIRTPLNAIIGFSELMIDEKFGPIGNDRYKDYLRDINRSGNHVLDLVNDLLDISKIEAGEQEMAYEAVALNDTLSETVAMMQPQANRERVIIRSSFASRLPEVVADLRSVRQIALNLLSNAIHYTQAGGQVIVSTAYETSGDIVMRVRDTGIGMSTAEIEQALKPFKQINALKRGRGDGTGLGLPLTKAMVEANRARFAISSTPGEGTLVEITFPSTRVLAD